MSAEVMRDKVATDGDTRYLTYAVQERDFYRIIKAMRSVSRLWTPKPLMVFGGFGVLGLEAALEERMILSEKDFVPSVESLGGAVRTRMFNREFDRLGILAPMEGHSRDWFGYFNVTGGQEAYVYLTPSLPNELQVRLPEQLAKGYDGVAVYEEISCGMDVLVKAT